ncbi:hypothetical protein OVY01_12105 [Robbsia sp. Bb-Pol-6]|uniref:Uncharacterized protein n=1 Tax=Robbsia betulipollinis TaxID=2981849 RepID=A0ABT3ZN47_9BURK|nr:hypothetical protein [Robbsia betulipollinis]MCY0387966.1 hypothetical protein [Robbsia betulipollinis]
MEQARKPVLLTVRSGQGRTPALPVVELADGTPIAGVSSAVLAIDDDGTPVLTIQLRRFSVDAAETDPAPYPWKDLGAPALPYHRA